MKLTFSCWECRAEMTAKITGIVGMYIRIEETHCSGHNCGHTFFMVKVEVAE